MAHFTLPIGIGHCIAMDKLQLSYVIGGSALSILLALGTAMWTDITTQFRHATKFAFAGIAACLLALVVAALLFFTSDGRAKAEEAGKAVGGDNFVNNGNNFGQMGNNVFNIGRQQFNFTDEVAKELTANLPHDRAIDIEILGSERSVVIGRQIVDFLRQSGFKIGAIGRTGGRSPPPASPLSFDGKLLTIDADI